MPGCELNTAIGAKAVVDRLAAYEETGLEPEDIEALQKREQGLAELLVNVSCGCAVSYTRLTELAQAEKDGWLVVMPPNDPLTLEELRELGDDWVWIKLLVPLYRMETGYYVKHKKFSSEDRLCCGYPDIVMRDLSYAGYGCDWLAYRRKPEEGTP